jgi:eukaryotic-like serine/threonine-protein kinase
MADYILDKPIEHVLHYLDFGQDADSDNYYIVMPLADGCLWDLVSNKGPLEWHDAVDILIQVALGLSNANDIVHRDIKPENILLHGGEWKIADLGIARFTRESTSDNTLRGFLSEDYAAPEQWNGETCSHATDIYALGCVAHFVLTGRPPFAGSPNLREAHLSLQPPHLTSCGPPLSTMVELMLRKNQSARPSIDRVIKVLQQTLALGADSKQTDGYHKLQAAAARVEQAQSEREAAAASLRREKEQRERSFLTGAEILREAMSAVAERLRLRAPNLQFLEDKTRYALVLGSATLSVELPGAVDKPKEAFRLSKWEVVAFSTLTVKRQGQHAPVGFAVLLYARRPSEPEYRWWEVCIRPNPLFRGQARQLTFFEVDSAISGRVGGGCYMVQAPHIPMDDEALEGTCVRWGNWLAVAATPNV